MNWEQIVMQQKESGQTTKEFCEHHGINRATFYYWKKKLSEHSSFIRVKSEEISSGLELVYPNGVRLKIAHGANLADLKRLIDV
jgi:transposase-like protein